MSWYTRTSAMRMAAIIEVVPPDRPALWAPPGGDARTARSFSQNIARAARHDPDHPFELAAHGGERQIRRARTRDDDEIDVRREQRRSRAKRLAEQPLRPVAHDGAADLLRGDDPETARPAGGLSREEQHEVGSRDAGGEPLSLGGAVHRRCGASSRTWGVRPLLHTQEIAAFADPAALRVAGARGRGSAGCGDHGATSSSRRSSSPGACDPCGGGC